MFWLLGLDFFSTLELVLFTCMKFGVSFLKFCVVFNDRLRFLLNLKQLKLLSLEFFNY